MAELVNVPLTGWVVGTAELIRLALTTKIKPYRYVRRSGWVIRSRRRRLSRTLISGVISATHTIDDSYANGYSPASGPAKCCCARPMTCACCRWRCSAAT